MVPTTAPKVTAATAGSAAAAIVLFFLQQVDLSQLDGPLGLAVSLAVTALATWAGGWLKADTNPAPSARDALIMEGWKPPKGHG